MQKHTAQTIFAPIFTILSVLALAHPASADTINLMWDPNSESQVSGYIVHVGTQPGVHSQHVDVGLTTAWAYANAVAGQQYCFTVSAYFAGPLEGPRSSEVCGFSNAPPALVNPGSQGSTVGQADSLQLAGSDPMGDPLTYSATGLPPGLTLMASTGYISGTPTTAGTYSVTARATDGVLTASQTFTWTVSLTDTTAPAVSITSPTSAATYATSAVSLTIGGTASDAVGVTQVTWVNNRGGSGAATGTTSWSTSAIALQTGSNVLTVTARDAAGNTASDVLTVTVNAPPTLATVANQSSLMGLSTTLQLSGSDPNGDALTYSATGLPAGLSVTASSGLISGAPAQAGTYNVTASVSDGALSASRTFTWVVTAPAAPDTQVPTVAITTPTTATSFATTASTVSLGGTTGDNTGVTALTWSNDRGGNGTADRTVSPADEGLLAQWRFDDGSGTSAGETVGGKTGTLSGGATWASGRHGQAVSLDGVDDYVAVPTLDVSGTGLTITGWVKSSSFSTSIDQRFVSKSTDTAEQNHYWMLGQTNNGQNLLRFRLKTGTTTTTLVASTGDLPIGAWYHVAATYDGSMMRIYLNGAEVGAVQKTGALASNAAVPVNIGRSPDGSNAMHGSIDDVRIYARALSASEISAVSNTPDTAGSTWSVPAVALQSGANRITVTARDAAGNTSTDVLTVTYNAPNTAPTLAAVANQAAEVGKAASLQLTGADVDGGTLSYGANGLPPGLALAVSTGLIAGTPTAAGSYPVTVTVSDGALTATRTFTWTVTPETVAPGVAITNPTTATTYTATLASMTLGGTASDNVGVTQVIWSNSRGGSGVATGTTTWSVGITLQGGSNVLTVTARDAAGNSATDTLTVTYNTGDTTAPVVTITKPTTAATLTTASATINLSGTASDNVGVTRVSWSNDRGGSGTATGTTSWSANGVALQPGANVLTVTASDAAGNTKTDVLTVTFTDPLRIAGLAADRAAPQPLGTTVTFTAAAAGGGGTYEYQWRVYDGSKWVTKAGWSSNNRFAWTPASAISGYKVRAVVRVVGKSGTVMATMDFPIVP
ncbi:MAG TPA: putative Ig domain-containing protein [Vicinamibacterales bacterium]|nr:putative Ig domain-containing protein [Vicinamibacterales bacterium]